MRNEKFLPHLNYWVQQAIPNVYDDSLSLYELINKVVMYLNKVIDSQNGLSEDMKSFLEWADQSLEEWAKEQLNVWLVDGTLENIINETLMNKKVDKVVYDDQVEIYNNILKGVNSVLNYGADPTGIKDSYSAFKNAIKECDTVIVPIGKYKLLQELVIEKTDKVRVLMGHERSQTLLYFENSGLTIAKGNVIVKGLFLEGSDNGHGIKIDSESWITVENMRTAHFNVGVDLSSSEKYMITVKFDDVITSYNKLHGFFIKSRSSNERNVISFKNCYSNRNGDNVDDSRAPATTKTGVGFMFDGVNGVYLESCVSEYNSGAGVYITNETADVKGYTQLNHWFEGNKYAQLYVDNFNKFDAQGQSTFRNIFTAGSYYGGGFDSIPVENAIKERRAYVKRKVIIADKLSWDINIDGISYSGLNQDSLFIDPTNVYYRYNDLKLLLDSYLNVETFKGSEVIAISNANSYFSPNVVSCHLKETTNYDFSIDYVNITGVKTQKITITLYNRATSEIIVTKSLDVGEWSPEWTEDFKTYRFSFNNFKECDAYLLIGVDNPSPSTKVLFKNIHIKKVQRGIVE